jgi:hypothetical protein
MWRKDRGSGWISAREGPRADIIPRAELTPAPSVLQSRENRDWTDRKGEKRTFYDTISREMQEMQQELSSDRINSQRFSEAQGAFSHRNTDSEVAYLRNEVQRLREALAVQRAAALSAGETFLQREEGFKREIERLKGDLALEKGRKEPNRRLSLQSRSATPPITVTLQPFPTERRPRRL